MGKVTLSYRKMVINIKRGRQTKIKKLLAKFSLAKNEAEKKAIVAKARRVNPNITEAEFAMRAGGKKTA